MKSGLTCKNTAKFFTPDFFNIHFKITFQCRRGLQSISYLSSVTEKFLHSNIYPTRCNVTHFIYIWKLLYMFRVVFPPIVRSTQNCIYSIWYLANIYFYLSLSWKSWNCSLNSSTIVAGSSNGLTNTRCCRHSFVLLVIGGESTRNM